LEFAIAIRYRWFYVADMPACVAHVNIQRVPDML
jgi:hypothetical protein